MMLSSPYHEDIIPMIRFTLAVSLTAKQLERFLIRIVWLFVVWFIR
jgi:hypothetical protein